MGFPRNKAPQELDSPAWNRLPRKAPQRWGSLEVPDVSSLADPSHSGVWGCTFNTWVLGPEPMSSACTARAFTHQVSSQSLVPPWHFIKGPGRSQHTPGVFFSRLRLCGNAWLHHWPALPSSAHWQGDALSLSVYYIICETPGSTPLEFMSRENLGTEMLLEW